MILDFFTRVVLLFKFFNSNGTTPVGHPLLPNNLSYSYEDLFNGPNDTVVIENPYFASDTDDHTSYKGLVTLPLCCDFHPDGEGSPFCPSKDGSDKDKGREAGHWYPVPHLFPTENRSQYNFEVRKPTCSSPLKVVKLSTDEFEVGNQGRFLENGYFGYTRDEYYSPHEYCITALTGEFVQVMICDSKDCRSTQPSSSVEEGSRRPCIQKCCNPDEIYSFSRRECIKSKGALFRPIFYHDLSHKLSDSEQSHVLPHYHIAFPRSFKYQCEKNKTLIIPAGAELAQYLSNVTNKKFYSAHFKIRIDGKIMLRRDGKAIVEHEEGTPIYVSEKSKKCYTLTTSDYCIDGAAEYGSANPFSNAESEIFFVICPESLNFVPKRGPLNIVYGNVMITSSVFSLLTVIIYMVLKEKQNIHGWTIASYAFSMFLMYIFLGLAHLLRYYRSDDVLRTASCVTIGIASHLFSMSSFLWLSLMNWDLFSTFRKFRPANRNGRGKEVKHFLTYSMFGWGIPIFITGISTFLHFKYEEASEDDCAVVGVPPLPAYGRESCEIKQLSLGVYLYFPAALLLTCNLLFFIVTTYKLCRHSKQTQLATKNLERHHQSVQLFAKLFFVMGVTRVFEVISWAESGPKLTWYWAVFDIFNVLQAVAIFIIYVCKRDVLDSLKKLILLRVLKRQNVIPKEGRSRQSQSVPGQRKSESLTNALSAVPLLITTGSTEKIKTENATKDISDTNINS